MQGTLQMVLKSTGSDLEMVSYVMYGDIRLASDTRIGVILYIPHRVPIPVGRGVSKLPPVGNCTFHWKM